MARKPTPAQERRIMHRNWGYWDGVADRSRQRLAKWYRGAHKTYGHYDADYAEGYSIGLFAGAAPPFAMLGQED
jgi:hypothetical protein